MSSGVSGQDVPPDIAARPQNPPELGWSPPVYRILLVEDHPDTCKALARLLRGTGHTGVRGALEHLSKSRFDLLLSDLNLEDGSAADLMRHARGLGMRGIAISGSSTVLDRHECTHAGFATFMIKPIKVDQLESAIREVMRGYVPAFGAG